MLKVGRKAPAFTLADQEGKMQTLKQYAGTSVLLYFYPKDDTPGCTKEACAIAEVYKDFKKLGVTVIGVSKDSSKSHKKFAVKYNLPFTLLSDESTEMIQAYGAWAEKKMMGKTFMGTLRISYLIGADGKIARVYPDVDPASHALQLLTDIKAIRKEEKAAAKLVAQ
ncbi:thioredoxin-dependent thiol peroxidase [Patescibacteria group bacterium]|nr:thioredoxin-dependent thiol peroxidase [Patescibacteria group bacterium]